MGTQKDHKAMKESKSHSPTHRMITTLQGVIDTCHLTPLTKSRKSKSTLHPTKSPYFSPRASTPNPARTKRRWQAQVKELFVSLLKTGKDYGEISQQLAGRSESACKNHFHRILKHKTQESNAQDEDDLEGVKDSRKLWKDWEDQFITMNHNAGKDWQEISGLLPSRSAISIEARWLKCLRPRLQETFTSNPQITNRIIRRWTQQEDQRDITNQIAGKSWQEISGLLPSRVPRWRAIKPRLQTDSAPPPTLQLPKLQNPKFQSNLGNMPGVKWSQWEEHLLVSLVNAIGRRWEDIGKEMPGRTATACQRRYRLCRGREYGTGGPSPADWMNYWDNAPDPEEAEMDAVEPELAGRDANEDVRLGAGDLLRLQSARYRLSRRTAAPSMRRRGK